MECRDLDGFIDAYLDGEFGDLERVEVEAHLSRCDTCQAAVAEHAGFKQAVRQACGLAVVPGQLLTNLRGRLEHLDADPASYQDSEADRELFGHTPACSMRQLAASRPWRSVPLFASAAFLLGFVWLTSGGFTQDTFAEAAVDTHRRGLPMEIKVSDPAQLQGWLRGKVDFHPHLPTLRTQLAPAGARLSHLRDRQAVYVTYSAPLRGSAPLGLFVFEGPGGPLTDEPHLLRRVGKHEVLVTQRRGYAVAIWRQGGLSYSLVSEGGEAELLRTLPHLP